MKMQFTKQYISDNSGCYDSKKVDELIEKVGENPTLKQLFDTIPIKDFCWFLVRKCELTQAQKINSAYADAADSADSAAYAAAYAAAAAFKDFVWTFIESLKK